MSEKFPPAGYVIGKVVRCSSCGKPVKVDSYNQESGLLKLVSHGCGGSPFQNIHPQPAAVTVG